MKITYRRRKYDVSIIDAFHIQKEKQMLFLKRQKRRLKLLFCKQDLVLYFLITLFWVAFGVIIYLFSKYAMNVELQYYSVKNVLWDLAEPWFSSVILSFVIGAYNRISEHKRKINAQHYIYVTAMSDFQHIIDRFLGEERLHYHPLYSAKCLDDTIDYIKRNTEHSEFQLDKEMIVDLQIIIERLGKIEKEVGTGNIIFLHNQYILYSIEDAKRKIREILVSGNIQLEDIFELLREFLRILNGLRQPWRVDINRKIHILRRLNKNQNNEILDDFYYKMLLIGHPFPKDTLVVKVKRCKAGNKTPVAKG